MVTQIAIEEVLETQNEFWKSKKSGTERTVMKGLKILDNFALILTGIRRCGKSTLLLQLMQEQPDHVLFLNFEDPRLAGFETDDFRRLDTAIKKRKAQTLYLDEIQMMENWELYVRQKLDEGLRVVVTGSNATLLSKELGTKLTGRHLSYELFPFSYPEFLKFKNWENNLESVQFYIREGGFPEYLRLEEPGILHQLLDDILLRDIAVRYGVRDAKSLRRLAVYLLSNIAKPVSANKLASTFNIKAVSTILEYFSYMENAYLVQFVSKFSYSIQTQIRNPKKVYAIDLGLFTHNSIVFTEEQGRRLENCVYLHFRQKGFELYYYQEKKECDFIVMKKGVVQEAVQVCYDINDENIHREMAGLIDAMTHLNLERGRIITFNQRDVFTKDGKEIQLLPIMDLLME